MARKAWAAVHRYCGLALAGLLLVNALTGSLLAFEHEIDAWLNPGLHRTGHQRPALPPDELVARVEAADPRLRVSLLPLDGRPGQSAELRVLPRRDPATGRPHALGFDRLFVDPSSGAVLGRRQWGAARVDRVHLMTFLNVLHRKFHLPGAWGMRLTGALALAWLLAAPIGAGLTLPRAAGGRQGFWRRWRPAWQVKRGAAWQRTAFDLHRAGGLWSLPAALVLAVSGVYFSLGNEVFRPAVRLFSPLTPHPLAAMAAARPPPCAPVLSLGQAIERARVHLPGAARDFLPWQAGHLPQQGVFRIAFKEDGLRERPLRLRYEQVFIDDRTGALAGLSGYDSGTAGDRFLIWQYPLHSGRILGPWGRALVCAAGLVTALLCATGLLVWGARRRGRRRA